MEIDTWIAGYKVRSFPWIDEKLIYFNVQWFAPGQSIERPPIWDKTVFIKNDENGVKMVCNFADTLTNYIAQLKFPNNGHAKITVEKIAGTEGLKTELYNRYGKVSQNDC